MRPASSSREQIAHLILQRLQADNDELRHNFESSREAVGVRHCVIDDLLPPDVAQAIGDRFPQPSDMRLLSSFRERKYTSKALERFDPLMREMTFAVQDPRVVAAVEDITRIPGQLPDATLYAGGLSAMTRGHFLSPHIDNSHEATRRHYRTLNLLYYATPGWRLEDGGNLELWDPAVRKRLTVVSRFNRLVIMETTPTSWHSVSPVVADRVRRCVSNYYFSPFPPVGGGHFHVTSFSAWPEQTFRRAWAAVDNRVRQRLRMLRPGGFARPDVYDKPSR